MTVIASGRKALAVLLAAAAIGGALAPTAASAKDHHHGRNGAIFAGALFGGALLGSAIASSRDVGYERDCWIEKQKRYDEFGDFYVRRVRVCD